MLAVAAKNSLICLGAGLASQLLARGCDRISILGGLQGRDLGGGGDEGVGRGRVACVVWCT